MKIAVILGSQRLTGKNKEIYDHLLQLKLPHELSFIRMAEVNMNGCISCYKCTETKECIIKDDFQKIYSTLLQADSIFIITPVYAIIPSKLTALFERLTSLLFASGFMNTDDNPLLNKPAAIFSYCSNQICDETQLKVIFQKFIIKNYSFNKVNCKYINSCEDPNEIYNNDIIAYIEDVISTL